MGTTSLTNTVHIDTHPTAHPPTLDLVDDIEGIRVRFSTDRKPNPTRCSTVPFRFPVDTAYELSPLVLWTNKINPVIVRGSDGDVHTEITSHEAVDLPHGQYTADVSSLGLKIYLRVHGEMRIVPDTDHGRMLDCSTAESVQLGLRSFHESPTATVTTTDSPHDIMRAVSCLGSALKTTSCERSFPTLRGHPPLIERGDRFHAPSGLERTAETASLRIEVPPTLESIYPVAPLAYYLNAVVQPGEESRLVGNGDTYRLDQGDGIEAGIAQLLKHVFTLDCITRTEGFYPITLGERTTLENRLSETSTEVDFAALYDYSLAERVQRYLSIPFGLVEDLVPRWPLTADVRPVAKHLSYLPFVVASIGTVRCLPTTCSWSPPVDPPEIEAFYRNEDHRTTHGEFIRGRDFAPRTPSGGSIRSPEDSFDRALSPDIHSPPDSDSIAQLWLAEGYPIQGAKPSLTAYQRRFDAITAETYEVAVISNDVRMAAESDVADLYENQEQMGFDVTIHEQLSCEDLRDVFAEEYDLVHYVGHVDADGLQCSDGWLDANTLETVNTRMFVLNGCRSYEQGQTLVDNGAISGLCTLTNVGNTPATQIGRTVAQLLNGGFSLSGVLDIIGEDFLTGQQYMIVGDPSMAIVQRHDDTSVLAEITPTSEEEQYLVDIYGYPTIRSPIGMLYAPEIDDKETYFLNSGHMTTVTASRAEVRDYLRHDRFPVRIDGTFTWSNAASLDGID